MRSLLNQARGLNVTSKPLEWVRTGLITLRCEPYLIISYPTAYAALYGDPGARDEIGHYPTAAEAQKACEAHRQKEAPASI